MKERCKLCGFVATDFTNNMYKHFKTQHGDKIINFIVDNVEVIYDQEEKEEMWLNERD